MALSFVTVIIVQVLLITARTDTGELAKSVLAVADLQSSPNAFLFWFLGTAIVAYFYYQALRQGVRRTLSRFRTFPGWLRTFLAVSGSTAVPLVMAGTAVALTIRLYFLNTATSIQFFILMLGILFAQHESLSILALRLGYSDIRRVVNRGGPAIPAPGFPVMGVIGACAGFFIVLFVADSLPVIAAIVLLMVAATAAIWYYRQRSPALHTKRGSTSASAAAIGCAEIRGFIPGHSCRFSSRDFLAVGRKQGKIQE